MLAMSSFKQYTRERLSIHIMNLSVLLHWPGLIHQCIGLEDHWILVAPEAMPEKERGVAPVVALEDRPIVVPATYH